MAPSKENRKSSTKHELAEVDGDSHEEQTFSISTGIDKQLIGGCSERALPLLFRYTVAQIVQEEEIDLGRSVTEPFVASLTELVYAQAGRNTIREEDVKLVARKSNALQELLEEESSRFTERTSTKATSKSRPRPTRAGGTSSLSRKPAS